MGTWLVAVENYQFLKAFNERPASSNVKCDPSKVWGGGGRGGVVRHQGCRHQGEMGLKGIGTQHKA